MKIKTIIGIILMLPAIISAFILLVELLIYMFTQFTGESIIIAIIASFFIGAALIADNNNN